MLWQGEDNGIRYACTHTLKKRAHQATLVGRKRTMGKKLLSQVHGAREGQNTESDLKKVRMVMRRGGEGHLVSMSNQFITKRIIFPIILELIINVLTHRFFYLSVCN